MEKVLKLCHFERSEKSSINYQANIINISVFFETIFYGFNFFLLLIMLILLICQYKIMESG